MITDGQGLVENGALAADELKQRKLLLFAEEIDAAIETEAIFRIAEETGFDAFERRWSLSSARAVGLQQSPVLAKRRFIARSWKTAKQNNSLQQQL